jgi:hypothetical protein
MAGSSYPASRIVAPRVASHFSRLHDDKRTKGVGPTPPASVVEALIEAAFWASLRRQEDYDPTISLAYLPLEDAGQPLLLSAPILLQPEALARLAPAVERPGIHLGVWSIDGQLAVWGATHRLPPMCFVIEVIAPGLLVIKQSTAGDSAKFINVAVLEGDQVKELNTLSVDWPDGPPIVRTLLAMHSSPPAESSTTLVQLAESMRRHKRGGSLLLVPPDTDQWRESIVSPMPYSVAPLYSELRDVLKPGPIGCRDASQEAIRAIDMIAGLTAVDGASVLTEDFSLLAFGAKITRRDGRPLVERVVESEPVGSASVRLVHPTQLGGTRHLSAAQFAQDQRDAVALVASQDGRFTVFAWSPSHEAVHAYRVETLLL